MNSKGLSLIELTVVIAILGITALVVISNLSSSDAQKIDLAANSIAEAIRFARSESMRLRKPYGIDPIQSSLRVRVFRVDTTTSPWSAVWDVYHPLSKKLYNLKFNRNQHRMVTLDSLVRSSSYRGTCQSSRERYYFDANGSPRCLEPANIPLNWYKVVLRLGSHSRTVTLHGPSGRVSME